MQKVPVHKTEAILKKLGKVRPSYSGKSKAAAKIG
jgi:hypothetical protein